jgi:hypothetical protein
VENVKPGQLATVPVHIEVQEGLDVSGLQFRAVILPQSGAPVVAEAPVFTAAGGMPAPKFTLTKGGSIACGWPIGSYQPAITGDTLLGYVQFTVPATAKQGQSYIVRFLKADGSTLTSEGKYVRYKFQSSPGTVWVESAVLTPPDVISDEWRECFFGRVDHPLAKALADPDGDGVNNLQEFLAGANPAKLRFHMLSSEWKAQGKAFRLKWLAAAGSKYVVECTTDPVNGPWKAISEALAGNGNLKEFEAQKSDPKAMFYRVRKVQ